MWFSTECSYKGRGKAEFSDINGIIEGDVEVVFQEDGSATVRMKAELLTTTFDIGIFQFLTGEPTQTYPDGSTGYSFGGGQNTCTNLSVSTHDGIFSSSNGIVYSYSTGPFGDTETTIDFHLTYSQFDVNEESKVEYWVLPLCNFISKFRSQHDEIDAHPLRFRRLLENTETSVLTNSRVIGFLFNNHASYIEPLDDYEERKRKLESGQERVLITSVMVGKAEGLSLELDRINDWLPPSFIRLLSLSTGIRVGAPWIEFRNASGQLVRRCHVQKDISSFSSGHRPIEESVHSGLGYLLTKYDSSVIRGSSYHSVLFKHIVQGSTKGGSIEDALTYIVRAFEGLLNHHNIKSQNLMRNLNSSNESSVKSALSIAKAAIKQLAQSAQIAGSSNEHRILDKIAERTSNIANKDNDFGLAVSELLDIYNLPDINVVDAHIAANPRADRITSFASLLSKYRGVIIHEGYFAFSSGMHDFADIIQIKDHLIDILLRISFQIVGYDGTYQPPIIRLSTSEKMDWVDSATSASTLGYK